VEPVRKYNIKYMNTFYLTHTHPHPLLTQTFLPVDQTGVVTVPLWYESGLSILIPCILGNVRFHALYLKNIFEVFHFSSQTRITHNSVVQYVSWCYTLSKERKKCSKI